MHTQFALKIIETIESGPKHLPLPDSRYVPEYLLDLRNRLRAGNQVTPSDEVILETLYRRLGGFADAPTKYGLTSPLKRLARSSRA